MTTAQDLKAAIRDVPDFPKKGIIFKDITPILKDPELLRGTIDLLVKRYEDQGIDYVVGVEARGFILASALAMRLGAGFIPVRKPGKLPCDTHKATYDLEYGTDSIEIHQDAVRAGDRVLIADDLLATGGTLEAAVKLIESIGGKVDTCIVAIELAFLEGRKRAPGKEIVSLLRYD